MMDAMTENSRDDTYSDEEADRRATEALRRSLTTPHKPQKEMVGKAGRAQSKRGTKSARSVPKD
jgi:hypothetical protein